MIGLFDGIRATPGPPLTGLALWLKAGAGVTLSGSNVTAWNDQSGNGHNVTGTGGSEPTFNASSVNGQPGITFTSAGTILNGTTNPLTTGSARSVLVVMKSAGVNGGVLVGFRNSIHPFNCELVNGTAVAGQCIWFSDASTYFEEAQLGSLPADMFAEFYGTVGSPISVVFNGTPKTLSVGAGSGLINTDDGSSGFVIGNLQASFIADLPWQGDICEVLVYDHVLTGSDLTAARAYVNAKYGL